MQSARFWRRTLSLLENVGDVFAGKGLVGESIFHGSSDRLETVKLAQGHDLLDVMFGVEAPFFQLLVVILSLGAQSQETQEEFLIARLLALQQQRLNVVGQFVILIAVVAAD